MTTWSTTVYIRRGVCNMDNVLRVYMYVYYVYIFTFICTYLCRCMHTHPHTHTHTHMYTYWHTYILKGILTTCTLGYGSKVIQTYGYIHIHTYLHIHIYQHTYNIIHKHTKHIRSGLVSRVSQIYVCVYTHVFTYLCIRTRVLQYTKKKSKVGQESRVSRVQTHINMYTYIYLRYTRTHSPIHKNSM